MYVALFVCFSAKALHLELLSNLTTAAIMAILRPFIGHGGVPSFIWSDTGTNFVVATKEMKDILRNNKSNQKKTEYCASLRIRWKFTPKHTPHFGGIWEAAVKSFKAHLRRIIGEARLTFEKLTEVFIQIEACLNSRHLAQLPETLNGFQALTPGHFLMGKPLTTLPDHSTVDEPITLIKQWCLCQILL